MQYGADERRSKYVKLWINKEKWQDQFSKIPRVLQNKALAEMDAAYLARGWRANESGKDKDGNIWISVSPTEHRDAQAYRNFALSVHADAVDVESSDVKNIFGNNPAALGIARTIQQGGAEAAALNLIAISDAEDGIDEFADRLHQVARLTVNGGSIDLSDENVGAIETDLMEQGFLQADDVIAQNRWLERDAEKPLGSDYSREDFENEVFEQNLQDAADFGGDDGNW
jgi:hypothetical protein